MLGKKARIFIRSDAFMALYGHTRGREGVVLISGTGAMGLACDKNGALHTVGGWGRLTGDEGSGYYIALSGIKAALRAYDGIGKPTSLTEILPKYFGCDSMRRLIDVFYGSPPPEIAPFAETVAEQAKLVTPFRFRYYTERRSFLPATQNSLSAGWSRKSGL